MNNPLLSICIPTYNRADYLNQSIQSIVNSDGFGDKVEIVISDNCSTDNTEITCLQWSEKYTNIKYFKQSKPTDIADKNFIDAMSLGTGQYLKLNNDSLTFKKHTLNLMLEAIEKHIMTKETLFFHMTRFGKNKNNKSVLINNLDDFINIASGDMTWISNFGCWKKDFDKLENKEEYIHTQFMQVDWALRLFMINSFAYIYSGNFYNLLPINKKGIVDLFDVYGNKYLSVYEDYLKNGLIKKSTVQKERRNTFFKILMPIYIYSAYKKDKFYKKDKLFDYLKFFKYDVVFYIQLFTLLPYHLLFLTIRKIVRVSN
ncbi:MAG: glycosyltransferase family 2 protein [Endomicrobiaceae bacterium]|nr:glycosyltransferase family 2 protein [Endomicrobiaceae bacterium]